jgi:uncharacterized protein (TIGR02444 family)
MNASNGTKLDSGGIDFPADPFWDFSLRIYGAEGVSDSCVALQDECGADVNLLLFCGWLGTTGWGRLGPEDIRAAHDKIIAWQSGVVEPLRAVLRRLRQGFSTIPLEHSDSLRESVMALELVAEHVEQTSLSASIEAPEEPEGTPQERAEVTAANIADYFVMGGIREIGDWRRHLVVLMTTFFPDLDGPDAAYLLQSAFSEAAQSKDAFDKHKAQQQDQT